MSQSLSLYFFFNLTILLLQSKAKPKVNRDSWRFFANLDISLYIHLIALAVELSIFFKLFIYVIIITGHFDNIWYIKIFETYISLPNSFHHSNIEDSWLIWAPSSEFVSSSIPSWQISTAHVQPFRGARDLVSCLTVPLDSLLIWASSEGSGETARMRKLAWTFAARICDKYQIRLTRPTIMIVTLIIPRTPKMHVNKFQII